MKTLLLSPHDDDSVLFAAFTCIREKPVVVICTDSAIQAKRGEIGCSAFERARESALAHDILDCPVYRLSVPDDTCDETALVMKLKEHFPEVEDSDVIYAPALQGGNPVHDLVNRAAHRVFPGKVVEYTTYSKDALYTEGTIELKPTAEEQKLKKQALDCYESQLRINLAHFQAVNGKSEWLKMPDTKLHLGCGKDKRDGWINLDRTQGDVIADLTTGIPLESNSIDYVYSQDLLEHLPAEARVPVINEIYRVLKHNGVMEHYVPNAGSRNDYGSPSHLSHWNLQLFEHFDIDSYRWEKDRGYEGFIGAFRKDLAELVNIQQEEDGIARAQNIHVKYRAVKNDARINA